MEDVNTTEGPYRGQYQLFEFSRLRSISREMNALRTNGLDLKSGLLTSLDVDVGSNDKCPA
jgi:hypothetical protein